ncbi:MAG TPA: murein biosynthesis integral membrane protein MurJ, partial [candidate division Zixibacteria bacterium]|nr:murein biosynthesis integral membrane protein MurJ [candidate division Zixibacteria bacterium]
AITLIGALTASGFVYIAAEGFRDDPEKFALAVDLTRWLFPYLFFISLAALLMGILNSYGKFGAPAFSSSLFNIAMILSMYFLYDAFATPVYCLVVGVLVGGVGQFAVQLPSLYRAGHRLRFDFTFRDSGLKAIGRLLAPIMIGLGAGRVNILVSSLLASLQGAGAVSYLVYAYQLMHFPLGVFAVAIGTVALPKASAEVADGRLDKVAGTLRSSVRMILFLVVPSTVYLMFFNDDLVRLIYQRGAFGASDTAAVQLALFWYTFGLLAFAGVRVITPVYYAFDDSRTPMRYSLWMVGLNIALSFVLVYTPPFTMGFAGLAAATSLASWLQVYLLLNGLRPRGALRDGGSYLESVWKTIFAAVCMAAALHWQPWDLTWGYAGIAGKALAVVLEVALGALVYILATIIVGLSETRRVLSRVRGLI